MLADSIEAKWIDAFCEIFERCAVKPGDTAAILSETQSRTLNVHLAELALLRLGAKPFHIVVPTPRNKQVVPIRSTGASEAIQRLAPVVSALQQAGFVVDCTIEGLMHAVETPEILKAGARILVISNEHPEALERMVPDAALEKRVRAAAKMLRGTKRMRVTSKAGTELDVNMIGASTVGVWGWTDKPQTPTVEAPIILTSSSVPALEVTRIRLVPRSIFAAARTRFSRAASGTMRSSASGCSFEITRMRAPALSISGV